MSTKSELNTFHFDLSKFSNEREFTILAGDGKRVALKRYVDHPSKLDEHRSRNTALQLIPEHQLHRLTHFAEAVELSATKASIRRVSFPSLDDHPLPEIAMVFTYCPRAHVAAAHARFYRKGRRAPHPYALDAFGVDRRHYHALLAGARAGVAHAIHYDAENIQPPGVTAQSLVLHHPELGSVAPGVMQFLKTEYLNPANNPDLQELVNYIENTQPGVGPYSWYNKSWAVWSKNDDGTGDMVPAEVNPDITCKGGAKIDWPTNPDTGRPGIPSYNLTDEYDPPKGDPANPSLIEAAGPAIRSTLLATKNDDGLNGVLWTKQNGVTQVSQTSVSAPKHFARAAAARGGAPHAPMARQATARAAAADGAPKGFTLKNLTSSYGLDIYDLSFDPTTQTLTFPLKNWPSRYLGAYVQFQKENGSPIKRADIPNWPDKLPADFLKGFLQPSDSKNYLDWLSSGNAVFGIPIPPLTQTTTLSFPWPQDATKAQLLLGGLGCASGFKDWDSDVDVVGVVGTGIVNYGVSSAVLALNVYVINPYIAGLEGDAKIGFYFIIGLIGVDGLIIGVKNKDTSFGKFILSKLAGAAASAIFGAVIRGVIGVAAKAFIKYFFGLTAEFMVQISAEEAIEIVPVAGWAVRIASIAADIASLAATTIECVLSPATYSFELLHTMDLQVTVKPDPTHGKKGFNPVWPAVADHYVIQVKYPSASSQDGGTTYTLAGPMPGAADAAISVTFPGIPAGGKLEVVANIYSATDWLAGTWNSGWIDASPDANDSLAVSGSIVELLVPLTATTTYGHKQTLAYSQASQHNWQVVAFSVDADLVSDFNAGGAPSAAIATAFAARGNVIGPSAKIAVTTPMQAWTLTDSASGAVFSVKTTQLTLVQVFQLTLSTYSGGLDAGGAPSQGLSDAFSNAKFALPAGAQITVVKAGSQWTIGLAGKLPLFALAAKDQNIDVKQSSYELSVVNAVLPAPPLPAIYPLSTAPSGNALGALQNIIINDKEFQLGYAYLASGQNMPMDNQPGATSAPMYAMQSISTLASPQAQIYLPTKGFSLPTFIAYDQFGLTPLFTLDASIASKLASGPVSKDVVTEFGKYGFKLPPTDVVAVVAANKDWTIGASGATPDYELRVTTEQQNDKDTPVIGVYDYPIPTLDNFFLEPQPATLNAPLDFYLRGVDLDKPPGVYNFNYSSSADPNIWGIFQNATPFQELAVHPNGYVIGLDNANAKMFALKLPGNAVAPANAPMAMPLAGKGGREGLLDGPQALTIAADGRVLILETGTKYIPQPRIQAFDVKGNPVPSFSVGQPSFTITADAAKIIAELDQAQASLTLLQLFQQHFKPALAPKAVASDSLANIASDLDKSVADSLFIAVLQHYHLADDKAASGDFTVTVTKPGALWFVTDKKTSASYDVRLETDPGSGFEVIDIYLSFALSVAIRSKGVDWKVDDSVNAMTFEITKAASTTTLTAQKLSSWMPLRAQTVTGSLSYLDIATETKGFIYVLGVIDNNYNASKKPSDLTFQLDIYNPDGTPLLTAPQTGLNAGKITVDQYRSLFSLNYNVVIGPNTRTEPGVSQWIPSTPTPAH